MILTAAGTRGVARTYCEIHEFNAPARSRTTRSPTAHSSSSTRDGAPRPPVWRGPVVTRSLGSTLPISGALSPDREEPWRRIANPQKRFLEAATEATKRP